MACPVCLLRGGRGPTLRPVAEYPRPSSEGRAANMRAIRRTDTKPEIALRRALHRQGYRFRKDYRLDLADGKRVRPDIAFTARRVAVFVDGCFWHACPEHGGQAGEQHLVLGTQAAPERRAGPGRGCRAVGRGLGRRPGLGARAPRCGGDGRARGADRSGQPPSGPERDARSAPTTGRPWCRAAPGRRSDRPGGRARRRGRGGLAGDFRPERPIPRRGAASLAHS